MPIQYAAIDFGQLVEACQKVLGSALSTINTDGHSSFSMRTNSRSSAIILTSIRLIDGLLKVVRHSDGVSASSLKQVCH